MLIITAAHSGGDKTFTYPCVIEGWSSWPWWPVIYRDGLPVVHRRSTTQVLTRQCTAGSWTRNLVVAKILRAVQILRPRLSGKVSAAEFIGSRFSTVMGWTHYYYYYYYYYIVPFHDISEGTTTSERWLWGA